MRAGPRGPARGQAFRGLPVRGRGRPVGSKDRGGKAFPVLAPVFDARRVSLARGVADRLGSVMQDRNVAASELASAAAVCTGTVHSHCSGQTSPSLWTLLSYSIALGCSLADLLPEEVHHP